LVILICCKNGLLVVAPLNDMMRAIGNNYTG